MYPTISSIIFTIFLINASTLFASSSFSILISFKYTNFFCLFRNTFLKSISLSTILQPLARLIIPFNIAFEFALPFRFTTAFGHFILQAASMKFALLLNTSDCLSCCSNIYLDENSKANILSFFGCCCFIKNEKSNGLG